MMLYVFTLRDLQMKFFVCVLLLCFGILAFQSDSFGEDKARIGVVINEVLYNLPMGRDLEEWVELYNNSDRTIDLEGWIIDDEDRHRFSFPPGIKLSPGQYLVFFTSKEYAQRSPVREKEDVVLVFYQTKNKEFWTRQIWNNDGDAILLKDAQGTLVDYIAFGNSDGKGRNKGDLQPEDVGFQGNIPTAPPGYSIAIFPNGHDTNSATDWEIRASEDITPGEENR
jgi:hypothetical protein